MRQLCTTIYSTFLLKQLLLQQQHQQYWPSLLQHNPCGCEYILLLDMYYYFVLEYQLSVFLTFLCSLNCISLCIEDCHCACVRFWGVVINHALAVGVCLLLNLEIKRCLFWPSRWSIIGKWLCHQISMHGYLAIHNQVWLRLPIDEAQWVHSILCRPLCTYFLLAYRCCNHAIHNNLCNNSRRYASSQWCNPLDWSAYQLTLYYLVMRSASHHITFVLKSSYLVVISFLHYYS